MVDVFEQQFSRYGIPDTVLTDNGPQFSSREFAAFVRDWDFNHITSSPYHPQSNGKAESAVKIAKKLLKRCMVGRESFGKALLDWRNTPTEGMDCSPVQRLMSRRCKTTLPIATRLLRPFVQRNVRKKLSNKVRMPSIILMEEPEICLNFYRNKRFVFKM